MSLNVVSLSSGSKAEIDIQQHNPTDSNKSISLLPFLSGVVNPHGQDKKGKTGRFPQGLTGISNSREEEKKAFCK